MKIKKSAVVILAVILAVLPLSVCGFAAEHIHTPAEEIVTFGDKYHGHYCVDCGQVADMEEHIIPDENWIPDGNEHFLFNSTETGTCTVCGAKITRTVEESATYTGFLNPEKNPYITMIIEYLSMILNMIKSLFAA